MHTINGLRTSSCQYRRSQVSVASQPRNPLAAHSTPGVPKQKSQPGRSHRHQSPIHCSFVFARPGARHVRQTRNSQGSTLKLKNPNWARRDRNGKPSASQAPGPKAKQDCDPTATSEKAAIPMRQPITPVVHRLRFIIRDTLVMIRTNAEPLHLP